MHAALYLLLGRAMLPPEEGWALFLLWVCAHVGGFVASKVNLPPLLGMLIAGIILRNIPQGHYHAPLPQETFEQLHMLTSVSNLSRTCTQSVSTLWCNIWSCCGDLRVLIR